MGHVNHFNFSGRRAYFPRVQWEQTAVPPPPPLTKFLHPPLLGKLTTETHNSCSLFSSRAAQSSCSSGATRVATCKDIVEVCLSGPCASTVPTRPRARRTAGVLSRPGLQRSTQSRGPEHVRKRGGGGV